MLNVAQAEAPIGKEKTYPKGLPEYKEFAFDVVSTKWSEDQWEFFDDLITRESNWNPNAQNKTSTAFGVGQFLNSTWKIVGCEKTAEINKQIICTADYVEKIYETPEKAILHHNQANWY